MPNPPGVKGMTFVIKLAPATKAASKYEKTSIFSEIEVM